MVYVWLQEGRTTADCVMGMFELAWFISVVFVILPQITFGKKGSSNSIWSFQQFFVKMNFTV